MDIEHIIYIDYLKRKYNIIPEILNIIYNYINLRGGYNSIIDKHIEHQRQLSNNLSKLISKSFNIIEHIKIEIFYLNDHSHYTLHPNYISYSFNYSPQIDFQFEILYECEFEEIILYSNPTFYTNLK